MVADDPRPVTPEWVERTPVAPLAHQLEDTPRLIAEPWQANFSEMGTCKTKTLIDAASELHRRGELDLVLVICPAGVRGGWDDPDPELGQLALHAWGPWVVRRLDAAAKGETAATLAASFTALRTGNPRPLVWLTTSYDFIRPLVRAKVLRAALKKAGLRYLLVLDESHYVKSRSAKRSKSCKVLREGAGRCVIMTGTPYANNVMDLWFQLHLLDPESIHNLDFYTFRARYARMGGWQMKQVVGINQDTFPELQEHLKRWVFRRESATCLDLPDKLYSQLEVPLTATTWQLYIQMREDFIAYLESATATAEHAGSKAIRLAQLTSGIFAENQEDGTTLKRLISDEKRQALVSFIQEHPEEPGILIWCRFRPEITRLVEILREQVPDADVVWVAGGQSDNQRREAVATLTKGRRTILVGQPQAGGVGLNLTRAALVFYLSNDFSLVNRQQSEKRAHRQGQTRSVKIYDVLATSPTGRKTVDHHVLTALKKKIDLATWTLEKWRSIVAE